VTWTPDGRRLAYHRYPATEVEVVDVDEGGRITTIHPTSTQGIMFPRFSPDGSRMAAMAWTPDGNRQVAVFRSDDLTPDLTLTGPVEGTPISFEWSPDGTRILAVPWESTEVWELDPAGGPGKRASWSAAFPESIEWQRLAEAQRR
jgi:Tol biopolymer transport system component